MRPYFLALTLALCVNALAAEFAGYADLQAALDAQPGKVITLPAGDYPISRKLVLRGDGAGLVGRVASSRRTPTNRSSRSTASRMSSCAISP